VCEHHGVLPNPAAAELGPGPVQHLPLQPIGQRASWPRRRTHRSVRRRRRRDEEGRREEEGGGGRELMQLCTE